jgi:chromosome segregation ATPase
MVNPSVLSADAILYCAAEPDGREFPKGSDWPGDAWSTERGGEPVGKKTNAQALLDLKDAQKTIDRLSAQLDTATHSLAQRAAERDEAVGKLDAMEQRAITAESGQATAEAAAKGYMTERDQARADAKRFSDAVDSYRPEAEKVPGLVAELEAANQRVADLQPPLTAEQSDKPKKGGTSD